MAGPRGRRTRPPGFLHERPSAGTQRVWDGRAFSEALPQPSRPVQTGRTCLCGAQVRGGGHRVGASRPGPPCWLTVSGPLSLSGPQPPCPPEEGDRPVSTEPTRQSSRPEDKLEDGARTFQPGTCVLGSWEMGLPTRDTLGPRASAVGEQSLPVASPTVGALGETRLRPGASSGGGGRGQLGAKGLRGPPNWPPSRRRRETEAPRACS